MKAIFTYPNNAATSYIDPLYVGDASDGFQKRIQDLKDGNYKIWNGTAPTDTVSDLMSNISKFNNYYNTIGRNNVSIADMHNYPLLTGTITDTQQDVTATLQSNTIAEPSVITSSSHGLTNGSIVAASNFDGDLSFINGDNLYVNVIDSNTIKLALDSGLTQFIGIKEVAGAVITNAVGGGDMLCTSVGHNLLNTMEVTTSGFNSIWLNGVLDNQATHFVEYVDANTFYLCTDIALTNRVGLPFANVLFTADAIDITNEYATINLYSNTIPSGARLRMHTSDFGSVTIRSANGLYKWIKQIGTSSIYELYEDQDLTTQMPSIGQITNNSIFWYGLNHSYDTRTMFADQSGSNWVFETSAPLPADERTITFTQYGCLPQFNNFNAGYGVGADAFNVLTYGGTTDTYANNVYHLKDLTNNRYEVYTDKTLTIPVPTNTTSSTLTIDRAFDFRTIVPGYVTQSEITADTGEVLSDLYTANQWLFGLFTLTDETITSSTDMWIRPTGTNWMPNVTVAQKDALPDPVRIVGTSLTYGGKKLWGMRRHSPHPVNMTDWLTALQASVLGSWVDNAFFEYAGSNSFTCPTTNFSNYNVGDSYYGHLENGGNFYKVIIEIVSKVGNLMTSNITNYPGGTSVGNGDYFVYTTQQDASVSPPATATFNTGANIDFKFTSEFNNDYPQLEVPLMRIGNATVTGQSLYTDSTTGNVDEEVGDILDGVISIAPGTGVVSTQGTMFYDDPPIYTLSSIELVIPAENNYNYQNSSNVATPGAEVTSTYQNTDGTVYIHPATPNITLTTDSNGRLSGATLNAPLDGYNAAGGISLGVQPLPDQYVPPAPNTAADEDIFDTADYWTQYGYAQSQKEFGKNIIPTSASITYVQPSTTNMSQNGRKYVRSSGFVKTKLEVNYTNLTKAEFQELHADAQAARGQAATFYLVVGLWGGKVLNFYANASRSNPRLVTPYAAGETLLKLGGFNSNEQDVFKKGEMIIGNNGNENGDLLTVLNTVDANVYGEAKIRVAYGNPYSAINGTKVFKNPYWIVVSLDSDEFQYTVDTFGLYNVTVGFETGSYT